jgi:hypothetical protein
LGADERPTFRVGSPTTLEGVIRELNRIDAFIGQLVDHLKIKVGDGTPETNVVGSPGNLYVSRSGGASTTLYVKETGTKTTTGWVAK